MLPHGCRIGFVVVGNATSLMWASRLTVRGLGENEDGPVDVAILRGEEAYDVDETASWARTEIAG